LLHKYSDLTYQSDDQVKKHAQAVASSFGIPLSTLVNAYLMELAETGQIHFITVEVMTPQMEKIIEDAQKEVAAGKTVGPFDTAKDAINCLKKL
jgi:antitoxin component of RelBE/YafQ-DinJ toxin-antitoxin module